VTASVVTVGVDVASRAPGTAACWVRWEDGAATVERVVPGLDDDHLAAVLREPVEKVGLDVPLGWPDGFVEAVARHQAREPFGDGGIESLARRRTDRWVHEQIHQLPLSVSTDRIAYPAMRMARLLGESGVNEEPRPAVDRSGAGKFVEVYPAAALLVWGLPHRRYKGTAGGALRAGILDALHRRCPWLTAHSTAWTEIARTDHAFDALICALIARARQRDLCHPIPREQRETAAREGWIAVPLPESLEHLGV